LAPALEAQRFLARASISEDHTALPEKTTLKPGLAEFGAPADPAGDSYATVTSAPSQAIGKIGINYKF
jgi:hypothetical protein